MTVVLDASVLIAVLDGHDAHHERASGLLRDHAAEPFAAGVVTLAEVLVGPARSGMLARAQDALDTLRVTSVALAADASARLAGLRAETGLKLPDCCVLLAAHQVQASTVLTFDARLDAAARASGFATS